MTKNVVFLAFLMFFFVVCLSSCLEADNSLSINFKGKVAYQTKSTNEKYFINIYDAVAGRRLYTNISLDEDGYFGPISFTMPQTPVIYFETSNINGQILKAVYPFDLRNPPILGVNTVFVNIDEKTTNAANNLEKKLNTKLGIDSINISINDWIDSVLESGGFYVSWTNYGINVVGKIDQLLATKDVRYILSLDIKPKDGYSVGFNTPVSIEANVLNLEKEKNVNYKFEIIGGLLKGKVQNGNNRVFNFETLSARDSIEYLTEHKLLYLPDKITVIGINPYNLEEISYHVRATAEVDGYKIMAEKVITPTEVSLGIQNVPIGSVVILNTKKNNSYSWKLTNGKANLYENNTRNPYFIPEASSIYEISDGNGNTLNMYAGTYIGVGNIKTMGGTIADHPKIKLQLDNIEVCFSCHGPNSPVKSGSGGSKISYNIYEKFEKWINTGHSRIMSWSLEGAGEPEISHYSDSCLSCHSVGYIEGKKLDDGGFYSKLKNYYSINTLFIGENGIFDLPTSAEIASTYWEELNNSYPKLAALSNIQCENCHGPVGSKNMESGEDLIMGPSHGKGIIDKISYDSSLCGTCHGEPPRHNRYQLWQQTESSGHANYDLALSASRVNGHCDRCHNAQGFIEWSKQIKETNNAGNLANDYFEKYKWRIQDNSANVHPVTCVACHDPHDTGLDGIGALVRVYDNVITPAGFNVSGYGYGALCIACHNSRNGTHNDRVVMKDFQAPHSASQGDVFAGENAYFVNAPTTSVHSLIDNTCAGCHMAPNPDKGINGTNHTFQVDKKVLCTSCHGGENVNIAISADAYQENIKKKIEEMAANIEDKLLSALPESFQISNWDSQTDSYNNVTLSKLNIERIVLFNNNSPIEIHGQMSMGLITKDKKLYMSRIADIKVGSATVFNYNDDLMKSLWNFYLIESDGSFGIHNPQYTEIVISKTLEMINKI